MKTQYKDRCFIKFRLFIERQNTKNQFYDSSNPKKVILKRFWKIFTFFYKFWKICNNFMGAFSKKWTFQKSKRRSHHAVCAKVECDIFPSWKPGTNFPWHCDKRTCWEKIMGLLRLYIPLEQILTTLNLPHPFWILCKIPNLFLTYSQLSRREKNNKHC